MKGSLALACVAACLIASQASAKTYPGMAAAGPAIAGNSVVWGAEYSDGSGAVKVDGRVVTRFEDPKGKKRRRSFTGVPGAVSASPTRVVYTLVDWRIVDEGITVADRASGAVVATYPAPSLRRSWEVFDIDEQGNIVAVQGERLVAFSLTVPKPRVLAKRLWGSSVSTAAGRVAYISMDADSAPDRLILADLSGKVLRRLDRYGKRRWPVGEVALTDRWVAWSVKRASYDAPSGPGNVFLKKL